MTVYLDFLKMNGLGNDYLFLDYLDTPVPDLDWRELALWVSDRHTGVGSDGLILILPPPEGSEAHAAMRMFNSDGSEGEMCGNGVRCLAWYTQRRGRGDGPEVRVSTPGGPITARVGTAAEEVEVDMGRPVFDSPDLPPTEGDRILLDTAGGSLEFWPVSMGNPHAVCLDPLPPGVDWRALGREVELDPAFPRRTNVEFATVRGENHLEVRVWERGSGATRACGTGAAASLVAAHSRGLVGEWARITLPGGDLHGTVDPEAGVKLTGPVQLSFVGRLAWPPDSDKLIGGAGFD